MNSELARQVHKTCEYAQMYGIAYAYLQAIAAMEQGLASSEAARAIKYLDERQTRIYDDEQVMKGAGK